MTETMPAEKSNSASWRAFVAAYLGWVFDYFEVYFLTIVIVPMAKEFGWSTGQVSLILSMQLASLAVGGVLWGYLCDRYGRRWALQLCILQYCVGTLARAFTPNFGYMLFFTIFAGIGIGGEYGVGQTLVTETVSKERRGAWSSMLYSGIFVGIVLAAVAGGLVLPHVGWSWSLIISSIPIVLVVLIRLGTPESALWEQRKSRGQHVAARSEFARASFLKPLLLCYATATFQLFAYYGITTLMPTYLVNVAGFSLSKTSWWVFFTGLAGLCGAVAAAFFIDRIGRRMTLSVSAVVGAVGGVLVFLLWQELQSLSGILAPFFLLYAGFGATASVFGSLFSEVFPVSLRATGMSSALQLARGTTFAAPLIASALYPVIGYPPLIIGAVVLLALLALIAWAFPETSGADVDY
ncbi:MFS transporter [Pigmentiphaga soli]|uniref:MFS transporter n=1 Tax=Pigmentiphaga soli TaxID=1007095 RepID=A0ABP8HCI6_9BURK